MTHFTIDTDNNITAHATVAAAKALEGGERFSNEAALAKLAANWPAARLVEIYNSLTGVTPVKKFKDRNTAAARIWAAIQNLEPAQGKDTPETSAEEVPVAEPEPTPEQPATEAMDAQQTPDAAPVEAPAKKKAARVKKAPVAKEATEAKAAKGTRAGSRTETVLALMKQPGGTTLKAIMVATQWQAHSVRGFISGTLGKKMGLTVVSAKGENGERNYSITA